MPPHQSLLIFMRHGHRHHVPIIKDRRDNGLSDKGKAQALETSQFMASFFSSELKLAISAQIRLATSPLQRCRETAEIVKEALRAFAVDFSVNEQLQEAVRTESPEMYLLRIRNAVQSWMVEVQEADRSVFDIWVSHGDWLPEAVRMLTGQDYDFSLAECVVLRFALPNNKYPMEIVKTSKP